MELDKCTSVCTGELVQTLGHRYKVDIPGLGLYCNRRYYYSLLIDQFTFHCRLTNFFYCRFT